MTIEADAGISHRRPKKIFGEQEKRRASRCVKSIQHFFAKLDLLYGKTL